ncbi:MAG: transposase, partial [Chlamydiales bacterium]
MCHFFLLFFDFHLLTKLARKQPSPVSHQELHLILNVQPYMNMDKRYPSDLSDKEWGLIADLMRPDPSGGRPPKHPRREILNAIF